MKNNEKIKKKRMNTQQDNQIITRKNDEIIMAVLYIIIMAPYRIYLGNRKGNIFEGFFLVLLVVSFLMHGVEGKQTVILDGFESRNDRILFRLLPEINDYIEYERYINNQPYLCRSMLQNQLTKNIPDQLITLPQKLTHQPCASLQSHQQPNLNIKLLQRADKVLNILNGICLYYTTDAFLYEYCHKEHIRQLDSIQTKHNNAKPEYQDISLGLFDPAAYHARSIKIQKASTPGELKDGKPVYANFSEEYDYMTVDDYENKLAELQVEEVFGGSVLFANAHLSGSDEYITDKPLLISLHCQDPSGNEIVNQAMLVTPYTFVYTNKNATCQRLLDYQTPQIKRTYFYDTSKDPIRVYGSYLYGNVEELCTQNWAWQQVKGQQDFENFLEEGSLLYLEYFNEKTQNIQKTFVSVKAIIHAQLIELDTILGRSFTFIPEYEAKQNEWGSAADISMIITCDLVLKKRLDHKRKLEFQYIGNSLAIIKANQGNEAKQGDNFVCMQRFESDERTVIIDFDISVNNHLWLEVYQVLIRTHANMFMPEFTKEILLLQNQQLSCFHILPERSQTNVKQEQKGFTSIIKLIKSQATFIFPDDLDCYYYVINIRNGGVVKLITKDASGMTYIYFLSEGQIIKMVEFANGTKQILKQNRYYENFTLPEPSLFQNYIYIKVSKLPNGTFFGGIWKYEDYVFFPRFQFFGERLLRLQRTSEYAYIRIFNLQKIKSRETMAISRWMKMLQDYYQMEEKVRNEEESLFHDQSYQISYEYSEGKNCGAPVNKMRKTTVTFKCGDYWYHIRKVLETSPCEYYLEIESTLLCKQGRKDVLQTDEQLFNKDIVDKVTNHGILCFPADSLFDIPSPFIYRGHLESN